MTHHDALAVAADHQQIVGLVALDLSALVGLGSSVARHGVASRIIAAGSGPARSIISTAESEDVALIVLGARGRGGDEGARRLRLGSVTQRVLSDSSRRTLIVP